MLATPSLAVKEGGLGEARHTALADGAHGQYTLSQSPTAATQPIYNRGSSPQPVRRGLHVAPEERWLPLFPLNTVLFPGAPLPLQIFEERYKAMVQHCLDEDSRFGVVLIRSGAEVGGPAVPHSVGTVAHIVQVNRVDGGRMFLAARGERRFRIKEITQNNPYMGGQVELLEEETDAELSPEDSETVRRSVVQHVSLSLGLRGGWVRDSRMPSDPKALSYFIGGLLQAGLAEKQALLEGPSVSERLESGLTLLRREIETLKERVARELRQRFGRQ